VRLHLSVHWVQPVSPYNSILIVIFDGAARDVQAAINAARILLPSMPKNPTYRKVNPADAPILILALTSDTMTRGQLYDTADTILAQKISQVKAWAR